MSIPNPAAVFRTMARYILRDLPGAGDLLDELEALDRAGHSVTLAEDSACSFHYADLMRPTAPRRRIEIVVREAVDA